MLRCGIRNMLFFWVALYGLVNLIPGLVSDGESSCTWLHAGLLAGYTAAILFWICRSGRRKEAGLRIPRGLVEAPSFLLPLVVFPMYNLLTNHDLSVEIGFVLQMLCATLAEELFFRGFLLSALRKHGTVTAVGLTSLTFALLHCLNFAGNSESAYVWLQICCSFCVSLYYCCLVVRFGSILPCAVAHFLTNITAAESVGGRWTYIGLICSMLICVIFSLMLIKNVRKRRQ